MLPDIPAELQTREFRICVESALVTKLQEDVIPFYFIQKGDSPDDRIRKIYASEFALMIGLTNQRDLFPLVPSIARWWQIAMWLDVDTKLVVPSKLELFTNAFILYLTIKHKRFTTMTATYASRRFLIDYSSVELRELIHGSDLLDPEDG